MKTFLWNFGLLLMFVCKKWNWLVHRRTPIFFSTNKHSFVPFCSVLRCLLWCSAAWYDSTWPVETCLKMNLSTFQNIILLTHFLCQRFLLCPVFRRQIYFVYSGKVGKSGSEFSLRTYFWMHQLSLRRGNL